MSLLLSLLTPSGATTVASGRAGATGAAITAKAVNQSAKASLGSTASDTAKKGILTSAVSSAGLTTRVAALKAMATSALGSLGTSGTAITVQANIVFGSGLGSLGGKSSVVTTASSSPTPTPTNAFAGGGGGHSRTDHYRKHADKIYKRHKPDPLWDNLEKSMREQLVPIRELVREIAPSTIVKPVEIWDEDEEELMLLGVW